VPDGARFLVVSPCSSHVLRNWSAERYAAVIEAAHRDHGLATILCGGPSATEAAMAAAIKSACRVPLVDQTGKDTLPQMLALLTRATVLLTPDSGPAHMGTAAGIPVIGLYAATNPARSGPYHSRHWCVDRYAAAARRYLKRDPQQLPWTQKIERPGVMDLIGVDDVRERLAALAAARLLESRA